MSVTRSRRLRGGFGLALDGNCTISFTVRVQLSDLDEAYRNQATVTGWDATSCQTSAPGGNSLLRDLSNGGKTVDTDGNSVTSDAGEDVPTPVALPSRIRVLRMTKAADISLATFRRS